MPYIIRQLEGKLITKVLLVFGTEVRTCIRNDKKAAHLVVIGADVSKRMVQNGGQEVASIYSSLQSRDYASALNPIRA